MAAGEGTTATAAAVVGGGTTAAAARPGLDLPTGGGEEWCTRGLKLCPPRVFTMVGLEKERRGWEEERMGWLGMKMKGGGSLNKRVREGERLNPCKIHKWAISG